MPPLPPMPPVQPRRATSQPIVRHSRNTDSEHQTKHVPASHITNPRNENPIIKQTGLSLGKRALAQGGRPLCPGNRNQRVTSQQDSWKTNYLYPHPDPYPAACPDPYPTVCYAPFPHSYPTYRYARMGLGLKVAMALPADGVAYNISRNNEYIQKISNRNGSIAHIAGKTYAHPFSTQQAIGTIHIDVYIYI